MSNKTNHRRGAEHQRIVIERRRSNASQPHRDKSKYSRKTKYKGADW